MRSGKASASVEETALTSALSAPEARSSGPSNVQTVLEQQGHGRIIHRPDGTIVWEPLPEKGASPNLTKAVALKVLGLLEVTASVVLATSGIVAAMSTWQHVEKAYAQGTVLTSRQLTRTVTHTVASTVAGLITGAVLGPVRAATHLVCKVAGPAAGGYVIHKGVICVRRNVVGAVGLIRCLRSGDMKKVLEALANIVVRAVSNEKFRQEFARFFGIEQLLSMISEALAQAGTIPGILPPGIAGASSGSWSPPLQLLLKALEALLQSRECRESCISSGGVPVLMKLVACTSTGEVTRTSSASMDAMSDTFSGTTLSLHRSGSSSPMSSDLLAHAAKAKRPGPSNGLSSIDDVASQALACLYHLAPHPAARDAIRASSSLPVVVGFISKQSVPDQHTCQAIKLVQAMAVESAAKDAIGLAGGVSALVDVVRTSAPKSQVQADAVAALYALMRGSPSNQLTLAHISGSFAQLNACHSALGSSWQSSKAELQALLSILSRFPASLPCHALPENEGAALNNKNVATCISHLSESQPRVPVSTSHVLANSINGTPLHDL